MTPCENCQTKNPYSYQFQNVCCRVRFLVGQPNREARAAWIDRWAKQGEHQMVAQVKDELKRIWEERSAA